jgi:outer membrane protein OmpA-like peptidoglycan-associated protein
MCRTYSGLKICDTPVSWRKASDSSIIEALLSDKSLVKGDQSAEKAPVFEKPSKDLETKAAISDKKVVIEFATGSDVLDNNAKSIIDREVVSLAKMFSGATMRVEGNTDGTGSDVVNKPLSKRRAQAVVNYLIKEYNFSPNRFIVVGNGSKKARDAGDNTDNQTYRTTDFMLVNNK